MSGTRVHEQRLQQLRAQLEVASLDVALITDDDSVYYFSGYHDYLHMEFGRPTILVVPRDGDSLLITPTLDAAMADATAHVDRIAPWNDGVGREWRAELPAALEGCSRVGIEIEHIPPVVRAAVERLLGGERLEDATPIIARMRMIKSAEELRIARHAGAVAEAMMEAGRATIGAGVAEFEVALATAEAGTRKAAALLAEHYEAPLMSPNTRFLQIMASGDQITRTHHRASNRVMQRGEPVFLCFCGMTNFHHFKLGFDRLFWIGEILDRRQEALYDVACASQSAALSAIGPGVTAESVHAAYAEVIREAGFDYPFRCGRATGFSFLEQPQLVSGDTTELQAGMVFAVDGSVSSESFRAQVGDSVIVTDDGYEKLTDHPKAIEDVVLPARA